MLRKFARLSLWMVPIIFVGLTAASMYGAAQTADEKTPAEQVVTGCLQKGLEPGGFFLIAANNQHWELYQNSKVPLADHVGQTVAVTGIFNPNRSAAQEGKSQPYEKKETGERKHGDFEVSSLKVVSQTCSK
ncbi:MAG TPA: hypothetical protein VFC29_17845 [Candidatus Limnocylindrales bacterium]|jgi:hypothetical protein|nr:hypothetical protein [Candidatus Limnocylindrales bacterium]